MADALAALGFLRGRREVDPRRVAAIGHSFGGSLTLLLAERDSGLRAAVVFSGAGYSWDRSAALRIRLLDAVRHSAVPIFFVHAANDYSLAAGKVLAAEMRKMGKPHRLAIYPSVGRTGDDGHDLVHVAVARWEPAVFDFLNRYLPR